MGQLVIGEGKALTTSHSTQAWDSWTGIMTDLWSTDSMSCRCMCVSLSRLIGVDEDNGRSKRTWSVIYGKKYGTLPVVASSNLLLLSSNMHYWVPSRSLDVLVVRPNEVFFRFGSVVWIVAQWMDPSCNITLHPLAVPHVWKEVRYTTRHGLF